MDIYREREIRLTREVREAPLIAHRTTAWALDKPTGKGFKAKRIIHGTCPLWRAYYRSLLMQCGRNRLVTCPYDYGGLPTRRRESALLVATSVAERLRRSGLSFCDVSMDQTNAFTCPSHDEIATTTDTLARQPSDAALFRHRIYNTVAHAHAMDGEFDVRLASGTVMGDSNATELYLSVAARIMLHWQFRSKQAIIFREPTLQLKCDGSITKFVDDVLKKVIVPCSVADARQCIAVLNDCYDAVAADYGCYQNIAKQVVV